uniref:Uncharacterized protein n=1 Tax=Ditylenchus dipsaci TaxID=166011 RepID=A0A915E5I7_9BILA
MPNTDRKLLFFVDSQEIGLKLENLKILVVHCIFEGAIQTAIIRPEPDSPLSLESPTRSLNIEAGQDIELMSSAGEIQLNALLDINLKSKQGDIRLESGNVYMSGLERSSGQGQAQYQLCICRMGRLFMAAESSRFAKSATSRRGQKLILGAIDIVVARWQGICYSKHLLTEIKNECMQVKIVSQLLN